MSRAELPLVRLSLLRPFLEELHRRNILSGPIFEEFDLEPELLEAPDVFVPAVTVYRLVESLAAAANDPYLGVQVGGSLDMLAWPVFGDAARNAGSLGDFLLGFAAGAMDQASSVEMRLNTDGRNATFCAHRVFEPAMAPAQVDGFYVGIFAGLLERCAGEHWSPGRVLVRVCDLRVIPPDLRTLLLTEGDRRGTSIRFPQSWLLLPFEIERFELNIDTGASYRAPPTSLEEAIQQALLPHIHRADLKVDEASSLCGYDRRLLGRKLKERGTSLANLIALLRKDQAAKMLLETDRPVAEIGNSVGFTDATVFSRSFKRWTGESPRDYRGRCRGR